MDILAGDDHDRGMILCVGATPAAQRVMVFRNLRLDTVNRSATVLDGAAGKSMNVAKVLRALGLDPLAVGFVGGLRGDELQSLLTSRGIRTELVKVSAPTRQCITVIDESAETHTELVEESKPISVDDYDRLIAIVRARLQNCQAVVLSGSLTPMGPSDFFLTCAHLACQAGVFCLVDAQGPALIETLEARPALVKPNRAELAKTLTRELHTETDTLRAMRQLCEQGAQRVVVTSGRGPVLALDGNKSWRILVPDVKVVNPIGSGDALAAGLVWGMLRGDELGEACRRGCAAGAANALTMMPGEVNREDVERLLPVITAEAIKS